MMNDALKNPPFSIPRATVIVKQEGFTLIETMLALLLLTVGLMAIAGMIDLSLGRNVDANRISLVTNLAADMVERIQFNRRNVTAYNNKVVTRRLARAIPGLRGNTRHAVCEFMKRVRGR